MGRSEEDSRSAEKMKPIMCYHPNLVPTQWNQSKPKPCKVITCRCGENQSCPICGWGQGSWPCNCMKEDVLERSITENAAVWQELADS